MIRAVFLAAVIAVTLAGGTPTEPEPLCVVSDVTAEDLAETMPEDIKHLADDVVEICRAEGIKAEFVAAIMRWERRLDIHNLFGWTGKNGRLMRFGSDRECLEYVLPRLKALYLTSGGKYYHGATVEGVSVCYNNTDAWREAIKGSMG